VPPLAAAIAAHDDDTIALLLAHGADPNRITADNYSPLYLTALTCTPTATRALLTAGARPELAPPGFDPTPVACPTVRDLLN
jgi:ankyrin repeat protein